jgi:Outer membrane lipoprotein-sorting protein
MAKLVRLTFFLLLAAGLAARSTLPVQASGLPGQPAVAATLSVEAVVDNLVRKNEERAMALYSAEATRIYRLVYRGFPGDREAEMTVRALYARPATKDFEVISESGSKLIVNRVFTKLLEGEKEAAQPELRDRTLLNRDNYEFTLAGYETTNQGGRYVLEVKPKSKSKFVYRGRIWVDETDFAITRIEAEPAQNPSFWTKRSEIRHEYAKIQGFWLPVRNESVSYIRLGGRATLTIEYKDYKLNIMPEVASAADRTTQGVR